MTFVGDLGLLPDGVDYTDVVDGVEWTFKVENGEAVIEKSNKTAAIPASTAGTVTVPDGLGKRRVMKIGDYAFYFCKSIASVSIPDSITSIGLRAFM